MENPAARSLMETVRKINEAGRRARSGELAVEDYLHAISADPVTEWFTELLREKREELTNERQRTDQLASALRAWYHAKDATKGGDSPDKAESELVNVLRGMEIIKP
jgi:hypothetical protein